jgi:hypothetical protein
MEWFEAKDFCPASTVDMCTEPVDLGSDMIQFEAINRHYGSIDTLFKVDGNLFNFSMGSRRPDSDFSEEEREVYQSILSSINFK